LAKEEDMFSFKILTFFKIGSFDGERNPCLQLLWTKLLWHCCSL